MNSRPSQFAVSRRTFLRTNVSGALACLAAKWARLQAAGEPKARARARSVILIFNCGAPSHIDLWDMKPHAPSAVRGPFQPIATTVPGLQISELMPDVARHARKLAVLRTVHHSHGQHNSGMYWSIVGRPYRIDSTLINPSRVDVPSVGTLVGWLAQRDGYSGAIPPYVITPFPHCDSTAYITPGQFGGCLGSRYDPLVINADPNQPNFKVSGVGISSDLTPERLRVRASLLDQMDRPLVGFQDDLPIHRSKALNLVISAEARRAFDLSREPASVRDRYGRHPWGQSHLLARRLVEAGVRFVTTVNGPSIVWDTHNDNFNALKNRLVPPMQTAFAALLDDLDQRGLLESTLVVWMGDFGRTPTINNNAGRDHWPQCYTMVLAGGGIRGGQVVGVSDATASYPKDRPLTPADVHATIFAALGYDHHSVTYLSAEGRPMPLSEGTPIAELL